MTDADYETLGVVIATAVTKAVVKATQPLESLIAELETKLAAVAARALVPGPQGEKGFDGVAGRDGLDGKDVDRDALRFELWEKLTGQLNDAVRSQIEQAVAGIPVPSDGKDGAPGRDGIDGKDGVDGVHGRNGIDGKDGADGLDGKDGESIVGPEGKPGRDGRDSSIAGPAGKDGAAGRDGKDGRDGLDGTLEGLEVVQVDERSWAFVRSADSGQIGLVKLSHPLDRGVFRDGTPYDAGDGVSFGGSFFIAQRAVTTERPEDGSGAWRLAVKRGRDGREGKAGPQGVQGLKGDRGEPGRDYR